MRLWVLRADVIAVEENVDLVAEVQGKLLEKGS
jgi:hypothetical protein